MKKFVLSDVFFYSLKDEELLFNWLQELDGVISIVGKANDLVVSTNGKLSDSELRELLAVFRRYSLNMSQLAQYCDEDNSEWFADKNKTWYSSVFEC